MNTPFSAVLIVKNEVNKLEKCINSINFADEIIVVDSGSSDGTPQLAESLGAKVIHQDWLGYGKQKQFAVNQATHNWVFCLDADEILSEELQMSLKTTLSNIKSNAYIINRRNRFMGRWLNHGEGYPDKNIRFFHRKHAHWSEALVHEHVICNELTTNMAGDLLHETDESIEIYLNKQNNYTSIQSHLLLERGKHCSNSQLILSPVIRFIKFYFFKRGFLDGIPGLIHITIGCFNGFIKYAKLKELETIKKG
ncbi:MAG: glycosyltransferase family 2 protein [Methylococcales bacterium]|nr:glycosyltransferase family 2 protein [Methylococcales bacterium]MBT7409719.1 glycosyltransferase family 2 protein [Methylococcales bacterium]